MNKFVWFDIIMITDDWNRPKKNFNYSFFYFILHVCLRVIGVCEEIYHERRDLAIFVDQNRKKFTKIISTWEISTI